MKDTISTIILVITIIGTGIALANLIDKGQEGLEADLKEVKTELKADIKEVKAGFKADLKEVKERISRVENHLMGLSEL